MVERTYKNLAGCRVIPQSSTSSGRPPVRLPQEVLDAASSTRIPEPYDFEVEKQVMRAKEERDQELALLRATDREELKRAVVVKMKNVTSADEDTCSRLLEQNNFDLEVSIEKYYQS